MPKPKLVTATVDTVEPTAITPKLLPVACASCQRSYLRELTTEEAALRHRL